ncbi:hypothetical protein WNZ14_15780 [Hoeflea sp. AS60]|uniref:hypothetical protein n=1 Tax=Hoeflea sp. AS60 TaxID=3135780 RepID=UPI00317417F6
MIREAILIAGATIVGNVVSVAAQIDPDLDQTGKYAGVYLCLPEATGGVWYDDKSNKWLGVKFTLDNERILFKIKKGETIEKITFLGRKTTTLGYSVKLGSVGSLEENGCYRWEEFRSALVPISNEGFFRCTSNVLDYTLNLDTMRYLAVFAYGFVDGRDNNNSTPSITAGKCSKISD